MKRLALIALGAAISGCNQISQVMVTGGSSASSSSTGTASGTGTTGRPGISAGTSGTVSGTASGTSGSTGGSSTGGSTGSSTGAEVEDAGPVDRFCKSIGGPCAASPSDCCTDSTCQNGTCAQPAPICAGYLEPCDTTVPCCDPDGGSALLTCTTFNDAGLSLCASPSGGAACSSDSDCPAPYACMDSTCAIPSTGNTCNNSNDPDYHTPCVVGDGCIVTQSELAAIESGGSAADPCYASGLVCLFVNTASGEEGICLEPTVAPPSYWSPDGVPFDDTVCNPNGPQCASYYTGADRTAPVCGPFILPVTSDRCMEACTTGDDCDSVTLDCVSGQCKPNYCYSDSASVSALSTTQMGYGGIAISSNAAVLFEPCDTGEDFPTACLPEYDDLNSGTSGICVRVGGDGGGTWGDPCDPNSYRNDLAGLCQAPDICVLGTCMPWCDLDSASCPAGTVCEPLSSGPLTSTAAGTSHSIGACAQACDPYEDSTQNGCQPFPIDGGQPLLGCKLSGNGSDTSPPPGNCVALIDDPIAVGKQCEPFGWLDPCVSGAQCLQGDDAGLDFVCQQLCDPEPSGSVSIPTPACPGGQSCIAFQTCIAAGGACAHEGTCQ